ncbi:MAG: YCF48-related protein [bacterium]|nr:YCF48-related protein [bacterium]
MPIKKFKIIFLALMLTLVLSGCGLTVNTGSNIGVGAGGATDGGIYQSVDKGTTWQQKTLIQSVGASRSFASVDIASLAFDPGDSQAIYAGSLDNGLFFSYNSGDSWQIAASLGKISVAAIAIDPADKCVIYAAAANKVYKSADCNRSWSQAYFDNDLQAKITSLAIDSFSSANIFIGTSRGDIIKSSDRGLSWRVAGRLDSQVEKIVISPAGGKAVFAGTVSQGLFRSLDGGATWASLSDKLKNFGDSQRFRDLVMVKKEKTEIFLANNYGLIKSTDGGNAWSSIALLTPQQRARINTIAVNPNNTAEIYYATDTTFYRSLDGGKNWSAKKLPTNRAGWRLLLDQKNPSIIYLAAKSLK